MSKRLSILIGVGGLFLCAVTSAHPALVEFRARYYAFGPQPFIDQQGTVPDIPTHGDFPEPPRAFLLRDGDGFRTCEARVKQFRKGWLSLQTESDSEVIEVRAEDVILFTGLTLTHTGRFNQHQVHAFVQRYLEFRPVAWPGDREARRDYTAMASRAMLLILPDGELKAVEGTLAMGPEAQVLLMGETTGEYRGSEVLLLTHRPLDALGKYPTRPLTPLPEIWAEFPPAFVPPKGSLAFLGCLPAIFGRLWFWGRHP